jgi:AhpD family alkylhydroperoxidase
MMQSGERSDPGVGARGVALGNLANAAWMLFDPDGWYAGLPAAVPDTGPLNRHFVRDIGSAFGVMSAALLLAAARPALRVAMLGIVSMFYVLHALVHVTDTPPVACRRRIDDRPAGVYVGPLAAGGHLPPHRPGYRRERRRAHRLRRRARHRSRRAAVRSRWGMRRSAASRHHRHDHPVHHQEPRNPVLRLMYWAMKRQFGRAITPFKVIFARLPRTVAAQLGIYFGLSGRYGIEPALGLLLQSHVAALNGCGFCVDIGRAMATYRGLTFEKLDAVAEFRTNPLFTPRERAALAYVEEATRTKRASDETFAALRTHFTDEQIVASRG